MATDNSKKDRRSFIKNLAIGTAAFTIVPRFVLGGKGFLAPSDKLYIAGVGAGGKGYSNLKNFATGGNASISFLCDVDTRRAARSVSENPKAKYYQDWRELLDKEAKNFDAVCVSTPDHNHAIITLAAMQLGKHVYVEKPLTHDIYEARILGEAAKRHKVVTQMGNQGSSHDGVRQMQEWYNAGLIGEVERIYCWTNRPVWPQGIPWPQQASPIPKELNWDLWLGTAPEKNYVDKLVPFNWRGWWDYGTGALGDMGCHLMEAPFTVLGLKSPESVEASVGSVYVDEFKRGYFPDSCPPSSHVILDFAQNSKKTKKVKLHWMDGGIQPERPEELGADEAFGDNGNGILFIGTKGKMLADTYNANARLLPLSRNKEVSIKQTLERVPNSMNGHYQQWVEACIAGYGKKPLSSPFEKAVPLTEALLIANLAIRAHDIKTEANGKTIFPGRNKKLLWDSENMKVTNFDEVNQFVKREYRNGWALTL